MTHLPGLGCRDINVALYAMALPGVSPSVHAYSLAQSARDKALRGPRSQEEEGVPDVLLSVTPFSDPCTQTRSVVPTAILSLAQDTFHGLLWPPIKCFCLALMSVCILPALDCQLLEDRDRVCLVYLLVSWCHSLSNCVALDWVFNLMGLFCHL